VRATRKFALASAALLTGTLLSMAPAAPASAAPPNCNIGLVFQNAYTPGNDDIWTPNCLLYPGTINNAVANLQGALNTCYHKGLAVDRDFGPKTKTALKQVQTALHVEVDGIYGPQTGRAMSWPIVGSGGGCKRVTF
jgi:hypothetical protein